MLGSFQWGAGGQKITSPEQAARQRSIAEALIAQSATPGQNWSEGLADVAAALSGTILQGRVDEAEAAGRERAGGLFANLALNSSPDSIIAALTSPDASWASDAQTSIASALLNQGLERSDPMYQLQLEQAQLQLDALRNPIPEPFTLGADQIRYDGNGNIIAQGLPGTPDTIVNNSIGNTDKFRETFDTESAKTFNTLIDSGAQAQLADARLGELENLIASAPSGATGALTSIAGSWGIPLEGVNEVQAAEAIINQLVPQQRPPGSGPMSDRDLELFKQSLPRIVNQRDGNQRIIRTLRAINEYTVKQGEIANAVAIGQMTPAEGRAALYSLPNPLATQPASSAVSGSAPSGITIRKLSD